MKPKTDRELVATFAMMAYTNEPCRICGDLIQPEDLRDLVYAGYGRRGRSAHGPCWNKLMRGWGNAETTVAIINLLEANRILLRPIDISYRDGKRRARRMRHRYPFAMVREEAE